MSDTPHLNLQGFVRKVQQRTAEPIAVIGMACRFPGAPDVEAFRRLLERGGSGISEVPADRWDADRYYDPEPAAPGKMCTRRGGFIEGMDEFAAEFFQITSSEAEAMDPQQRLLLETTWSAFEASNIDPKGLRGSRTGVYVGISTFDFAALMVGAEMNAFSPTGLAHAAAAGRISYVFDLRGPCEVLDTACSSSLVAVHNACRSLRGGECDLAVAAGVNAVLDPRFTIKFSEVGFLARDGRCKTFDGRADGYSRGEGCGALVLKRLADARRDGDLVLGLVRGSATNHDGLTQGLTAPNGLAQQAVIRQAMAAAAVEPAEIDYFEAHGTGTPLGDPQELFALGAVVAGSGRSRGPFVGSVKTNVGHLEAAAGVAGLIKVLLQLRDESLYPHINLSETNPNIPLRDLSLQIPTETIPWPAAAGRRRLAGVSSFGFTGTNAHVILEEAPDPAPPGQTEPRPERPGHVLLLSARSEPELRTLAGCYRDHLVAYPSLSLADLCHSANLGRARFKARLGIAAASGSQLADQLGAFAAATTSRAHVAEAAKGRPKVAFLFTGQGSQYPGMARDLYLTQPVFRRAIERCADLLGSHVDCGLVDLLYAPAGEPGRSGKPERPGRIDQTAYAQPALFAVEWALAELWRAWGVSPDAVFGHSLGDFVAACVAGVLSLEDALAIVAARGRLMQSAPGDGAMTAVMRDHAETCELIQPYRASVSIAALNGPENTVISGDRQAIEAIERTLASAAAAASDSPSRPPFRRLQVSHAFHSPLMEPILPEFARLAGRLSCATPRIPWISNSTGKVIGGSPDGEDLARQLREPVQFQAGIATLVELGCRVFVEIGPDPVMIGMARRLVTEDCQWRASLRSGAGDWETLLDSAAALAAHGVELDWRGFDEGYPRRPVRLPGSPLRRKRFPLPRFDAGGRPSAQPAGAPVNHPLLGRRLAAAEPVVQFEAMLDADTMSFLADHRVRGQIVYPGAAFVELILGGVREAFGRPECRLEAVRFVRPLVVSAGERRRLQLVLVPSASGRVDVRIASAAEAASAWEVHVEASVVPERGELELGDEVPSLEAMRGAFSTEVSVAEVYRQLDGHGLEYGPRFRGLERAFSGGPSRAGEAFGRVALPAVLQAPAPATMLHPVLLDSAWHLLSVAAASLGEHARAPAPWVPSAISHVTVGANPPAAGWAHVRIQPGGQGPEDHRVAELRLWDDRGGVIVDLRGLRLEALPVLPARPAEPSVAGHGFAATLLETQPERRRPLMLGFLLEEAAGILRQDVSEIEDLDLALFEIGMTSLMITELQYRIQKKLGFRLPARKGFEFDSPEALADFLIKCTLEARELAEAP